VNSRLQLVLSRSYEGPRRHFLSLLCALCASRPLCVLCVNPHSSLSPAPGSSGHTLNRGPLPRLISFVCHSYKKRASEKDASPERAQRVEGSSCSLPSAAFHIRYVLQSCVGLKSFVCHSYEKCRGCTQFFPKWNGASDKDASPEQAQRSEGSLFSTTRKELS